MTREILRRCRECKRRLPLDHFRQTSVPGPVMVCLKCNGERLPTEVVVKVKQENNRKRVRKLVIDNTPPSWKTERELRIRRMVEGRKEKR
jgi:hypothetical protein